MRAESVPPMTVGCAGRGASSKVNGLPLRLARLEKPISFSLGAPADGDGVDRDGRRLAAQGLLGGLGYRYDVGRDLEEVRVALAALDVVQEVAQLDRQRL